MAEENTSGFGIGFLIGAVAATVAWVLFGAFVIVGITENAATLQKSAIRYGYAEFDRTTGCWQWIKPDHED